MDGFIASLKADGRGTTLSALFGGEGDDKGDGLGQDNAATSCWWVLRAPARSRRAAGSCKVSAASAATSSPL